MVLLYSALGIELPVPCNAVVGGVEVAVEYGAHACRGPVSTVRAALGVIGARLDVKVAADDCEGLPHRPPWAQEAIHIPDHRKLKHVGACRDLGKLTPTAT